MCNFEYDDLIKKRFNNNPKEIFDKYTYDKGSELKDKIQKSNKCDLNIINEIVLWKLNRRVEINDQTMKKLDNIKTLNNIADDKIEELLNALIESNGIGLPMASTILHFFNPKLFPIFDQRAYRVIYKKQVNKSEYTAELYLDYLNKCKGYYKDNKLNNAGISFKDLDKYLYQLDKEIGNKVI